MKRIIATPATGRRGVAVTALLVLVLILGVGCRPARVGSRCRTADWGDDGGAWVLQCRNGRWVRALTKAQAAQIILSTRSTTTMTVAPPLSAASLDVAEADPDGVVHLVGWVYQMGADASAAGPNAPRVTVNGEVVATSNDPFDDQSTVGIRLGARPDVAAAYRLSSSAVGVDTWVDSIDTVNVVCLTAFKNGGYQDLACRTVTVATPSSWGVPRLHLDALSSSGTTIHASGFGLISHLPDPLDVVVNAQRRTGGSLEFVTASTVTSDGVRGDTAGPYPDAGSNHGFQADLDVNTPGTYYVCMSFSDVPTLFALAGWNYVFANSGPCADVTIP